MLGWIGAALLIVGLLIGNIWLEGGGVILIGYSLFRRFIQPNIKKGATTAAKYAPLLLAA